MKPDPEATSITVTTQQGAPCEYTPFGVDRRPLGHYKLRKPTTMDELSEALAERVRLINGEIINGK